MADLTPDEGAPFEAVARDAGLAVVYLVAPTTPPDRRAAIAGRSGGFLYCVSLVGVTGARSALPATVGALVRDVKAVSPVPVAVGFGVSKPAHVRAIAKAGADGVIVASALVDALGPDGRDVDGLARARRELRAATAAERGRRRSSARADARDRRGGRRQEDVRLGDRLARLVPVRQGPRPRASRRCSRRAARYAMVATARRARRCRDVDADDLDVVESVAGGGGTDFGVPSIDHRARPAPRRRPRKPSASPALVEAAWTVFDRRRRERSPAELRKGPRGGGRDRDKMIGHVIEADHALRPRDRHPPAGADRSPTARRSRPSAPRSSRSCASRPTARRSPTASGPPRYAARRIAWHALDHAWEMEDRTELGGESADGRSLPRRASRADPRRTRSAAAARAMTSAADRPPRAARGRRCRRPTSTASTRPAARISGWWRNVGGVARPSSRPSRIWAGVASSRSSTADDEVDALAQVVDDDA